MKIFSILFLIIVFLCISPGPVPAQTGKWTHFRGTGLDGKSAENEVPIAWNDSVNIIWKKEIEGKGWSSPVVYAGQVWLTTASADGKEMKGICVDLRSGKTIYSITLFKPSSLQKKHAINSWATPTPCIEEGYVYMNFGTCGTACISTSSGEVVWKRTDLNCEHAQGPGSSLFLYRHLLIVHCEGTDQQFIAGLDKATGKTVWRSDRPKELYEPLTPIGKKAYTTPVVINVKGSDLLISNGAAVCIAYEPLTGREVWRIPQGEDSTIAMPVTEDGIVYFFTSFVTPPRGEKYAELIAANPDGKGDISGKNVLWRYRSSILQLLTPIILDGLIYFVDTENNLLCLDAKTGETIYSKRMGTKYNSSPVFGGGYLFFTSVNGKTMVVKPGRELKIVGENQLPGQVYATPAIADKSILIRTDTHLYRIGK